MNDTITQSVMLEMKEGYSLEKAISNAEWKLRTKLDEYTKDRVKTEINFEMAWGRK